MRRIACICLALSFLIVDFRHSQTNADEPLSAELVARTEARSPQDERAGFHLPPGFEIQLVASDPDIHKPMNIAFDDRGRLWVTETIEYPYPAKDGTEPRDSVKILEDFGPDGKARKITTFAKGLNIPIGLLPMPGGNSALVHAIPTIDRHTDTNGDGVADTRELAYKTYGSRDTHGMTNAFTWGLDGWIYACHGFNNESEVKGKDGKPLVMQSGNTYRMKPDGSHAEAYTRGQVNPFGLCFDPLGNLYSADCHSKPVYQLLRGAYYPSFGKPSDGLGFGPEMVQHDHGSTAISGVVYFEASSFPEEFRRNIFIGNVVTNRINRDTIDWKGSTAKGILQDDFLRSDDPWFRPVDLKLGPDGALYVADFYNKIIGHYEVPLTHPGRDRERGRIWRIVYRGEDGKSPLRPLPDFTKMSDSELLAELDDPNYSRRVLAANQIVHRGGDSLIGQVKELTDPKRSATARVHALWILGRLNRLDDAVLASALTDPSREIRLHAGKIVGSKTNVSPQLMASLISGLKDSDPFVRRGAADALSLHPASGNVTPLIQARHQAKGEDEALVHVTRMALRDQFLGAASWPTPDDKALTEADLRVLADVAMGVHDMPSSRFLVGFLARYPGDQGQRNEQLHHVARYGDAETDARIFAIAREIQKDDPSVQADMIKSLHQGYQERGAPWTGAALDWSTEVSKELLGSKESDRVARGLALSEGLRLTANREVISAIVRSSDRPEAQRISALQALAVMNPELASEPLAPLLTQEGTPIAVREAAAQALAKTNQESARLKLVEALAITSDRLQTSIAAALAGNKLGAEALLAAVAQGKASARLLQERAVRIWLDGSDVPDLSARIAKLTEGFAPADSKVAELLVKRRTNLAASQADVARGSQVFKKNCAACHQLGGEGAKVGPQLDGIGVRGSDRLIEDVLDPNRNVDQAFRQSTFALKDGRILSGLLLREEGNVVIVADAEGKEVRIEAPSIEDRKTAPVSPMPADFSEKIVETDFYDLIAYLASRKAK